MTRSQRTAPPRMRWSMRVRVLSVVATATLLPLGILALTHVGERLHRDRVDVDLPSAASAVAVVIEHAALDDPAAISGVATTAMDYGVRVRIVDRTNGRVGMEVDHERGSQPPEGLLAWLIFPEDIPTLREVDRDLPPLLERPEVRAASARAETVTCRSDPRGVLLVCYATELAGERVVVVEQGTVRGVVRALYVRDRELWKLVLILLPIAGLLGAWLSWRIVRPLEALQREAFARARAADPSRPLSLQRGDEIGDVADALNALLAALHEKNRATERFVADLAHEVKSPIASIRACAEALELRASTLDDTKRARLAKNLRESSARLDAVVTELLEIARVEAGMPDEATNEVHLGPLVRGIQDRVAAAHPERSFRVEGSETARVSGVIARLETALFNLIDNAASFADVQIVVRISESDDVVTITVSDDGPGIDDVVIEKVFDRFFTTRGSRRGTGLGLAMVRAIAEAHGGGVRAGRAPAGGAALEMWIPRFPEK